MRCTSSCRCELRGIQRICSCSLTYASARAVQVTVVTTLGMLHASVLHTGQQQLVVGRQQRVRIQNMGSSCMPLFTCMQQ